MKSLSLLITVLSIAVAFSQFFPVPDYNLNQLEGTWYIQSIYDTTGNNWSLQYSFELIFTIINESVVNMTSSFFDGISNSLKSQTELLYPDSENPAILYQDTNHKMAPILVLNASSIPYWIHNSTNVTIFALNYTESGTEPYYIVLGGSKWYDTAYDIRPLLKIYDLHININTNFWFINTADDTHFGWEPLKNFDATSLLNKNWNLIGVYDPAGTPIVPWYTGGGIFDWDQAYCAQVTFQSGELHDLLMTLSLKSLYQGSFQRTWQVLPDPDINSVLMGFNINKNTLLYVSYSDIAGNIILTAGTTTSFFLSSTVASLSPIEKTIFEVNLATLGWKFNPNYISSLESSNC